MRTHNDPNPIASKLRDWQCGSGPLKVQLRDALVRLVLNGELSDGDRLPPERRLADALAVSRTTVVSAYDSLREEGLLQTRRGSASVIRFADGGSRLRQHRARTIRNTYELQPESRGNLIDFAIGDMMLAPPFEEYVYDFKAYMRRDSYGAGGLPELRSAIAAHYTRRGLRTAAEEVVITSGAQQAISLAIALCVQRGDAVAVQNPTFVLALDALRMAGARLHQLPAAASVQMLCDALVHRSTRAIYVIATNHNPTGYTMSNHERETLAHVAERLGITVLDDTVLDDLTYDGEAPPPLSSLCRSTTALTIGSLSKVFWSGLRIGWIRAPRAVVAQLTHLKTVTDLGNNVISQSIAMNVFGHYDAIRSYRQRELREKLGYTVDLLRRYLPSWTYSVPKGGFCLWITVPTPDVRPFWHLARRFGVNVIAGNSMSLEDGPQNALRIVFGGSKDTTAQGIRRLAAAWNAFTARGLAATARENAVMV